MTKKIDLTKYRVIRQHDGTITYATWHRGGFIGPNGCGGGLSYNLVGANVSPQWRRLDPERHHHVVSRLKQAVQDGAMSITPIDELRPIENVGDTWRPINPHDDLPKSCTLRRWSDGTWAYAIPEQELRAREKANFIVSCIAAILLLVVACFA